MDTLASFTSQCIAKAASQDIGSFLLSFDSEIETDSTCCSPSFKCHQMKKRISAPTPGGCSCLPPSDETTKESLLGEVDVWACTICRHLNGGGNEVCSLCWKERTILDAIEQEDEFKLMASPTSWWDLDDSSLAAKKNIVQPAIVVAPVSIISPVLMGPTTVDIGKDDVNMMVGARGGSPKVDVSSPMCYESTYTPYCPQGASPLSSHDLETNSMEVTSVASIHDAMDVCRRASLDSSIDDDDDDAFFMNLPNRAGPFPCPHSMCQAQLDDSRSLYVHIQQHKWEPHKIIVDENGVQNFICCHQDCGKVLEDKKLFRKHMLSHREKVFACHYAGCDRKFYERAKLKRHFLVHTGEKPFVCSFEHCGKRFGYNANLKTHMRTHTSSRPFACSAVKCKRRFSNPEDRDAHTLTHASSPKTRTKGKLSFRELRQRASSALGVDVKLEGEGRRLGCISNKVRHV